jgi:DNA-binding NarL/FixJ family response regulator
MKILLADDHPLFREGVKQVLCQLGEQTAIVDAQDYPSLFMQARIHPDLDLALIDLNMPGLPGQEGIREFRHRFPDVPLVILSASESLQDIEQSLNAGALGYVLKSSPSSVILHALQRVLSGGIYIPDPTGESGPGARLSPAPSAPRAEVALTTRQMEVLRGLLQGLPNKAIARRLDLTEGTVKIHVAAIFRALDVNNRTEAVIAARQFGFDVDRSKFGS